MEGGENMIQKYNRGNQANSISGAKGRLPRRTITIDSLVNTWLNKIRARFYDADMDIDYTTLINALVWVSIHRFYKGFEAEDWTNLWSLFKPELQNEVVIDAFQDMLVKQLPQLYEQLTQATGKQQVPGTHQKK